MGAWLLLLMSLIIILITLYLIYHYSKKALSNNYIPPLPLVYPSNISNPGFLDSCNSVDCPDNLICDPVDFLCKLGTGMNCKSNQCGPNLKCSGICVSSIVTPSNPELGTVGNYCPCDYGYECANFSNSQANYCYRASGFSCTLNGECISSLCSNGLCAYQALVGYPCESNKFCTSGNCSQIVNYTESTSPPSYCQNPGITSGLTGSDCSQSDICTGENLYCVSSGICSSNVGKLLETCNNTHLCNNNFICTTATGSVGFGVGQQPNSVSGKCYYPYSNNNNSFDIVDLFNYNNNNNTMFNNPFPGLTYNPNSINNENNFTINSGYGITIYLGASSNSTYNNNFSDRYYNISANAACTNDEYEFNNCIYQINYVNNNNYTTGLNFTGQENLELVQVYSNSSVNGYQMSLDKFFHTNVNNIDYYFMLNKDTSFFNGIGFYCSQSSNFFYQIITNTFYVSPGQNGVTGTCYITSSSTTDKYFRLSFENNSTFFIYDSVLSNGLLDITHSRYQNGQYLINDSSSNDTNFFDYFSSYDGASGMPVAFSNNDNISVQCIDSVYDNNTNAEYLIVTDKYNDIFLYNNTSWHFQGGGEINMKIDSNTMNFNNGNNYRNFNITFNYQPNSVKFYNDTYYVCFSCTNDIHGGCVKNNNFTDPNLSTPNNFLTHCPAYMNFSFLGYTSTASPQIGNHILMFSGSSNGYLIYPKYLGNNASEYYNVLDYSIYSTTDKGLAKGYAIMIIAFVTSPQNAFIMLYSFAAGGIILPYPVNPGTKCLATASGYYLAFNAICN